MKHDSHVTISGRTFTIDFTLAALQRIITEIQMGNRPTQSTADKGLRHNGCRAPTIFRYAESGPSEAELTRWPRLARYARQPDQSNKLRQHRRCQNDCLGRRGICLHRGRSSLRDRAKAYHPPLMKTDFSMLPNLLSRQDDLRSDRYGAFRKQPDGRYVEDVGSGWEMQRSMLSFTPHPKSPISLVDRGASHQASEGISFQAVRE